MQYDRDKLLKELQSELAYVKSQFERLNLPYDTVSLMWQYRKDAIEDEIERIKANVPPRS